MISASPPWDLCPLSKGVAEEREHILGRAEEDGPAQDRHAQSLTQSSLRAKGPRAINFRVWGWVNTWTGAETKATFGSRLLVAVGGWPDLRPTKGGLRDSLTPATQ